MIKRTREQINISKTVTTIIVINLIQIIVLLGMISYGYSLINENNLEVAGSIGIILYVVLAVIFVNSVMAIKDIYLLNNIRSKYCMQSKTINEIENFNKTLQGQRHDFLNHLQVVHSLIEMDEYSEARDYIKRVYHDANLVSSTLRTSNVAINALLQAKLQECKNKDIKVELSISTKLKGLRIPSWEMCRVLGNLIDNAVDALEFNDEKLLGIEIGVDVFGYYFKIVDNGEEIPQDIQQNIFEAGFTSKGERGEGMGLAIVKDIILKYQGKVNFNMNGEEKVFTVRVPY